MHQLRQLLFRLADEPSDRSGQQLGGRDPHLWPERVRYRLVLQLDIEADRGAGFPVLAGETGETYNGSDCPSTSYISDFLNYYQANKIGFEVWTWDTWGGCSTLSLISNYNGTAESPYGTFVQNFMESTYPQNP